MTINTEVLYKDKKFKIIYIYDSGYCEIRGVGNPFEVQLVPLIDIITI